MSFISGLEVIKKGGRQRTLENEVVGVGGFAWFASERHAGVAEEKATDY